MTAVVLEEDILRLHVFTLLPASDVFACGFVSHLWCSAQTSHELWEGFCISAGGLQEFQTDAQVRQPRDAYSAYMAALVRWRSGQPSSFVIPGEQLLEHDIGDHGLDPEDATTMLCGLCLDGNWLVLAFNGGVVQFWHLPSNICNSRFTLPINVIEIDFDLRGGRLAVSLANVSVAIYDCHPALQNSGSVSLPVLGSYNAFQSGAHFAHIQSAARHIAFWGPGLAVATDCTILVLGPEMEVELSVNDAQFWDMGKSFLIVRHGPEMFLCHWAQGHLQVHVRELTEPEDHEVLCGIDCGDDRPPKLLCLQGQCFWLQSFDSFDSWSMESSTESFSIASVRGEVWMPIACLDGSVSILQGSSPGLHPDLFLNDEQRGIARMLSSDASSPLAGEVCCPDVHQKSTAFVSYVDVIAVGKYCLNLLSVSGRTPPMHLGNLDLGSDSVNFLEDGQVLTASNQRFLVVSDRLGIHVFDFGSTKAKHE